jgi:hypothetical protein
VKKFAFIKIFFRWGVSTYKNAFKFTWLDLKEFFTCSISYSLIEIMELYVLAVQNDVRFDLHYLVYQEQWNEDVE